jgi:opacity protein-like surface antigen
MMVSSRVRAACVALCSVLVAGVLGSALVSPAAAQFRDVGYTFEPTVQGLFEDDASAVQNDPMYGGALGLSFGRYFQASAEYLVNTGLTTEFANVDPLQGLIDRQLDLRRYGARLRLNLYDRRVIPYLTAGSGILQFDPEGADVSRTIYGLAGGGITFSLQDRYRVSLGGELLSYRYDPVATFLGPTGVGDLETGTELVSIPALTASVALFLGGRSLDEQTIVDRALRDQFGDDGFLRGVQLFVNPFHGRVEFNDALGFPKDQNVAGVNAGVSLGPYVGLRGFYWRGTRGTNVTDEFARGFEDIQMYGGELQLRLNFDLGRGFVPYAKVGGGYLDVMDGYANDIPEGTTPPEDRFMGTSGLGLEVPLTQSIKLSGGARALLMSNPNVVEAGDPGDVYGSLMYTAGIEFRLGGGDRDRPASGPEPPSLLGGQTAPDDAAAGDASAGSVDEIPQGDLTPLERRLLARTDSLEQAIRSLRTGEATADAGAAPSSNVTDRTMTVPIPEKGEIYIRFGDGGGPGQARRDTARQTAASPTVEARVRRALQQQLQQQADSVQGLSDADVDRLIQRTIQDVARQREAQATQQRDDARSQQIRQLQSEIEALRQELRTEAERTETEPPSADPGPDAPFYRETLGRPLTYLVPITGFRAGEGPDQFQLGVRGDYRNRPDSKFHLVPELSLGLGGGEIAPTVLLGAAYTFLPQTTTELVGVPLEPYLGAGVGIASDGGFTFEPVSNLAFGVDYRLNSGRTFFLEYSTLDLLNTHRVHLGYRLRF